MEGLVVLKFVETVGANPETYIQEVPRGVQFFKVVGEVAKKTRMPVEDIVISVPGGTALTHSEYNLPVGEITERYGETFTIINRGVVGLFLK
ncbi:MAG: hypothetical protein ACXAC7_14165 [Candidatus Hodarchaeales archaeon]|jgi:hypothetical protein